MKVAQEQAAQKSVKEVVADPALLRVVGLLADLLEALAGLPPDVELSVPPAHQSVPSSVVVWVQRVLPYPLLVVVATAGDLAELGWRLVSVSQLG